MNYKTIKYYTQRELAAFFKSLENQRLGAITDYERRIAIRNEAYFKIMYYCGLRVSETSQITIEDFDSFKNSIYCKRLKGGHNNSIEILPSQYDRYGILDSFKRHLKFNKPNYYIFTSFSTNKPLSRKTADRIIKNLCKDVIENPKKMHCHVLRHTRSIQLAESGFTLEELQWWLGHVDISNTLIYFELTTKRQSAMYGKLRKVN